MCARVHMRKICTYSDDKGNANAIQMNRTAVRVLAHLQKGLCLLQGYLTGSKLSIGLVLCGGES